MIPPEKSAAVNRGLREAFGVTENSKTSPGLPEVIPRPWSFASSCADRHIY